MPANGVQRDRDRRTEASGGAAGRFVSEQSIVLRNYDGAQAHDVHVRFRDAEDELAFRRTVRLAPMEAVTIETRLERAVYRVEVELEDGARDSTECLVGSGIDETALVETGNGSVSVVEGLA